LPMVCPLHSIEQMSAGMYRIVLTDENATWSTELEQLINEVSVLIEDLDAVVLPTTDEQSAARIHGKRMGNVKLAMIAANSLL
jgi:hypothetical protein